MFEQKLQNLLLTLTLMLDEVQHSLPHCDSVCYEDNVEQDILLYRLEKRLARVQMSTIEIEHTLTFTERFLNTGLTSNTSF